MQEVSEDTIRDSGYSDDIVIEDEELIIEDEDESTVVSSIIIEDNEIVILDEFEEEDDSIEIESDEAEFDLMIEDSKLSNEELKLLEGSSISESELTDKDRLAIKQEARIRLIKSAKTYSIESDKKAYGVISTNTIQALRRSTYSDDIRKVGNELLKDAPPFLNMSQTSQVRKSLQMFDGSMTSSKEIFDQLDLPSSEKTSINIHLFHKYVQKCQKSKNLSDTDTKLIASQNNNTTMRFCSSMFKDQEFASPAMLYKLSENETELVEKIILGNKDITFTCGVCGCETKIPGYVASLVKTPEIVPIITPLLCTNCDTVNLIPHKSIKKLVSSLREKVNNIPRSADVKDLDDTIIYYPTNAELQLAIPELFEFCNTPIEKDEVDVLDWKSLCESYMKNLEIIHECKKNSIEGQVGIKNLVKILSSQANDYSEIKENAIASLIQELKNSPMYIISETYKNMISIPTYYSDRIDKYSDLIARSIASDCISEKVKGTEEIDLKILHKDFKKFEEYVDRYKSIRDRYIKTLDNYKYLYSNIPISSLKLTKEDVEDYLSDDKLYRVIDEVSDLMIIANIGENYIKYFRPRKTKFGEPVRDASYDIRFRSISNVNKLDKMSKSLIKYCEFFTDRIDKPVSLLNTENFILNFSTDYNFYSLISKFSKTLLIGDYYESMKVRTELIVRHKDELNLMSHNDKYSMIVSIILQCPIIEIPDNKYDFYFKDYGFSDLEKSTIIDLYNKKKIAPLELIGETFSEKCKYYTDLINFNNVKIFNIGEIDDFIEVNTAILLGMSHLDSSINFDDFLTYSLSRDFLSSLSILSLEDLCDSLFINKDICGMYLSEEYSIPHGEFDISKLIIYLPFIDIGVSTELYDDKNSIDDLRAILDSDKEVMLEEAKGLEIPTRIIKSFFNEV